VNNKEVGATSSKRCSRCSKTVQASGCSSRNSIKYFMFKYIKWCYFP